MPKLKSLRGARGSYGRVTAGGIIEVDDAQAKRLKATKRFVDATDADIAAAQKAQDASLAVQLVGIAPGFTPMPVFSVPPDRLHDQISRGDISVEDARRLVALQIDLSPEEIRAQLTEELDRVASEIRDLQAAHDARQDELDGRQAALDARTADLDARQAALNATAEDLDAREAALQSAPPPPDDDAAAPGADADAAPAAGGAKRKSGR